MLEMKTDELGWKVFDSAKLKRFASKFGDD
jgi:hypothetical protein